jgi:hypothetical protein
MSTSQHPLNHQQRINRETMESEAEEEQELETRVPDQGTVQDLYKLAGAIALVGLEFYIKDPAELDPKKIRLDRLSIDGTSYRATDVKRSVRLERNVTPGELTIGLASRQADDPVIGLLRRAKLDPKPYLNPMEERPVSATGNLWTPESGFERRQGKGSAPPFFQEPNRQPRRAFFPWNAGRGMPRSPAIRNETFLQPRNPLHVGPGVQAVQTQPRFMSPGANQNRPAGQFGNFGRNLGGGFADVPWQRKEGLVRPGENARFAGGLGRRAEGFEEGLGRRAEWPGDGRRYGQAEEVRGGEVRGNQEGFGYWGLNGEMGGRRNVGYQRAPDVGQLRGGFGVPEEEMIGRRGRVPSSPFEPAMEPPEGRTRMHAGGLAAVRRNQTETPGIGAQRELENRIAALESLRKSEMVRSGTSTELRRMLSPISPADHPGIFTIVDQFVTLHECPPTHRGPMCVAGACCGVLKEPHIKLAFLGEATWQFARRKCAEGGENLTERQIQEIEAQVLEFYQKQKVEGSKILDKAGIIPGRGGR